MYPRTATPENPWTKEEIREFRVRAGLPPEAQPWELPPPKAPLWPTVLGFVACWVFFVFFGLAVAGLYGFMVMLAMPLIMLVWHKLTALG